MENAEKPKAAAQLLQTDGTVHVATEQQKQKVQQHGSNGSASATDACWPEGVFYALLLLGFLFPPFWWACIVAGCRSGGRKECLIKQRRGLTTAHKIAWWACVVLSTASAVCLTLVLAIYYGRPTTGPPSYYITLSGPASAMPTIDSARLAMAAGAVHTALGLPADYPASTILVWLESAVQGTPTQPPAARRRLLQTTTNTTAQDTNEAALEFGFTLPQDADHPNATLPSSAEIEAKVQDVDVTATLADSLAAAGFVDEDKLGLLSVAMDRRSRRERERENHNRGQGHEGHGHGNDTTGDTESGHDGTLPLPAILGGNHNGCRGEWSPWGACNATCGSNSWKARNYTVTAKIHGQNKPCNVTEGTIQTEVKNCACGADNDGSGSGSGHPHHHND